MTQSDLSDPGPLPDLKWLPKDSFVVDHHYQRHTNSERSQAVIAKISRNFLWSRFQPPTVTPGPKGKYLVIDGQHRIAAAVQRADIGLIPVYIVPELSLQDQASNFVAINRDRVGLTPLAIHHAMVTMGDPDALRIKEVCDEADVTIARQPAQYGNTRPRETAALGAVKIGLAKFGEAAVIAALMIVPDTYQLALGMMRSTTLKALMHFFHDRGVASVDRQVLRLVLKEKAPPDLEEEARIHVRQHGGTTQGAVLESICTRYDQLLAEAPARAMIAPRDMRSILTVRPATAAPPKPAAPVIAAPASTPACTGEQQPAKPDPIRPRQERGIPPSCFSTLQACIDEAATGGHILLTAIAARRNIGKGALRPQISRLVEGGYLKREAHKVQGAGGTPAIFLTILKNPDGSEYTGPIPPPIPIAKPKPKRRAGPLSDLEKSIIDACTQIARETIPITHKEVARRLDTTQQRVARILQTLTVRGYLTSDTIGTVAIYKLRLKEIDDPDAPVINGVRVKRYEPRYADGYGLKLRRERYV